MTLLTSLMTTWWAWLAFSVLLGILELFAPGAVFVGFAIGAAVTGVLIGVGVTFGGNIAWIALFFAVVSVIAWFVMFKLIGGRGTQVKTFNEDINDN